MANLAPRYNAASTHQAEDGIKLIDMLSPAKNSRVLDLGCGTGYLASVLAERVGPGGKVVGVDPDKERIKLAQEKYAAGTSNLVFVEGNSDNFPEGPYDLVFMNYVLHWVKDKESLFGVGIYQNLAAGGRVAFIAGEGYSHLEDQVFKLIGCNPTTSYFFWTLDEYLKKSREYGYTAEFHSTTIREFTFPNVDAYLEWNSVSTGNQVQYDLRCVDPAILARFKEQFEGETPVKAEIPIATIILRKT